MKDSRIGESLWFAWDGDGYEPTIRNSSIYYTEGVVDLDNDLVRKALASSLQRDGLALSLSQGHMMIDAGITSLGFIGTLDGEIYQTVCDAEGGTYSGDQLDDVVEVTWAEVPTFD